MTRPPPPPRSSAVGLLLVFCLTALVVGIGFDLGASARVRFWIGDQPGAAAAIGAAAALFTILAALGARAVLGRATEQGKDSTDASADT